MSVFSNNLVAAQQSNIAGEAGNAPGMNARGTFSSVGMMSAGGSAFKWNAQNKALGPAIADANANKENVGLGHPSDEGGKQIGVIGVRSLILGSRDQQMMSEYGASRSLVGEKAVILNSGAKPPTGSAVGQQFGMRSVGATGFHRNTMLGQQQQNDMRGLSDVDVNSLVSAPHYISG